MNHSLTCRNCHHYKRIQEGPTLWAHKCAEGSDLVPHGTKETCLPFDDDARLNQDMYADKDHIEVGKVGKLFGHRGEYKYRVLGKDREFPIHHTNSYLDAVSYLNKCRRRWIADV